MWWEWSINKISSDDRLRSNLSGLRYPSRAQSPGSAVLFTRNCDRSDNKGAGVHDNEQLVRLLYTLEPSWNEQNSISGSALSKQACGLQPSRAIEDGGRSLPRFVHHALLACLLN